MIALARVSAMTHCPLRGHAPRLPRVDQDPEGLREKVGDRTRSRTCLPQARRGSEPGATTSGTDPEARSGSACTSRSRSRGIWRRGRQGSIPGSDTSHAGPQSCPLPSSLVPVEVYTAPVTPSESDLLDILHRGLAVARVPKRERSYLTC